MVVSITIQEQHLDLLCSSIDVPHSNSESLSFANQGLALEELPFGRQVDDVKGVQLHDLPFPAQMNAPIATADGHRANLSQEVMVICPFSGHWSDLCPVRAGFRVF